MKKLAILLAISLMFFMVGVKVEANDFDGFFYFFLIWGSLGIANSMYNTEWVDK